MVPVLMIWSLISDAMWLGGIEMIVADPLIMLVVQEQFAVAGTNTGVIFALSAEQIVRSSWVGLLITGAFPTTISCEIVSEQPSVEKVTSVTVYVPGSANV